MRNFPDGGRLRIAVENKNEGRRSIAWLLDYPGAFAYGVSQAEALARAVPAFEEYRAWLAARHADWPPEDRLHQTVLVDVWEEYQINEACEVVASEGYAVNAFFRDDWRPLSATEVERGLVLLDWSRTDLLERVSGLSAADWAWQPAFERWDVAGIVSHIASAEVWYLDRLGLARKGQILAHKVAASQEQL